MIQHGKITLANRKGISIVTTNLNHALHTTIVRIHTTKGTVADAGFLASKNIVCTWACFCGWLGLEQPGESLPLDEIHLDFPFLDGVACTAKIEA